MSKRSLDIALSFLLLVLSLPILVIAAILIKLDSEGSILFCQERMGRGFKTFQLLKLRTMKRSNEGLAYTFGSDPRITRVGRWLRFFKVDELPQLWNVLRGDMSMVGPRPVIPELAHEFKRSFERLLVARPGLTDPATLKYCREAEMLAAVPDPMRYFKAVVTPDKLLISQLYQERATVLKDICVLAATGLALLLPTESTLLIPTEEGRSSSLVFPDPMPAVHLVQRRNLVPSEATLQYPLELSRRDGFGRIMPAAPGIQRFRKIPAQDGSKRIRLVP